MQKQLTQEHINYSWNENSCHGNSSNFTRKTYKINLLTQGWGYTTTKLLDPGGNADGTNPTDTAKVSAVLGNDLVRDFNTTIRFDRIKPQLQLYKIGQQIQHTSTEH